MGIRLSSLLPASQRAALESLLFFNGQQGRVRHRIVESIESFGLPEIVESGSTLRVRLSGRHDAQSLIAVTDGAVPAPVGAVLYVRDQPERFVVVHMAVDAAHSSSGAQADQQVVLRLVEAVRAVASVTAGVRYVEFYYADGRARTMPVKKRSVQAR